MTHQIRNTIGRLALVTIVACGGTRTAPATQTPTAQQVAEAEAGGLTDLEGLACTAVALAPVIDIAREFVPGAGVMIPGTLSRPTNDLARSAQQLMAWGDARTVNAQASLDAQRAAAQARRVGDHYRAAQASAYATDLLHRTRDVEAAPVRSGRATGGPPSEQSELLPEYASLWALLLSTPDDAAGANARVAEIDKRDPWVQEDYLRVLLYAYRSFDFGCGKPSI